MHGDRFISSQCTNVLVCFPFHADNRRINTQCIGKLSSYRVNVRRELRLFRNHHRVDVRHNVSGAPDDRCGALEQIDTVGSRPLWIGVRKMEADIALRRRPENRIRHRMTEDVGVGMPDESHPVRNFDAAYDQPPAGLEAVKIVSSTNSHGALSASGSSLRASDHTLRHPEIVLGCDFDVRRFAIH